jgi:beta-glucanase (GH16 family)
MKKTYKVLSVILFAILLIFLSSCDSLTLKEKDNYQKIFEDIKINYSLGDSKDSVTKDLTLPLETSLNIDSTISWMTSHPDIIQANGIVMRPTKNTQVVIALVVTINNISKDYTTIVTVLAANNDISKFTASYKTDGGSHIVPGIFLKGEKIIRPDNPTKDNFEFVEWQLNGVSFDFTNQIYEDVTLVALWKQKDDTTEIIDPIPGRILSFRDEFIGTSIDTNKWSFQNGTGIEYGLNYWGNSEKQYYQEKNAEVSNGSLKIHAKEEEIYDPLAYVTMMYSSSKLVTFGKFSQTYGRFEARIKAPIGDGFWPAFWLMPISNTHGNGWPYNGEIDIVEMKGRLVNNVSSAIHFQGINNGHRYLAKETNLFNNSRIDEFHVYAVEWTPGKLEFSVDNYVYHTRSTTEFSEWYGNTGAPFDHEFYIILNLAIGGHFDGHRLPKKEDFPAVLELDFVRVYTQV